MKIFDLLALIGLSLMATGLWLWSPALSMTVVGSLLLIAAVIGRARK